MGHHLELSQALMNSLLAETTLQCTTVAAIMIKHHSVKVTNNQFLSLNNFPSLKVNVLITNAKERASQILLWKPKLTEVYLILS